jgi:glycosyltransferase involved in cell wall biosynthesis
VINNASTDGTGALARTVPGVRVVAEPVRGLVTARERARREATSDILAYVDADCRVPLHWLERIERRFARRRSTLAVTGPYRFYDWTGRAAPSSGRTTGWSRRPRTSSCTTASAKARSSTAGTSPFAERHWIASEGSTSPSSFMGKIRTSVAYGRTGRFDVIAITDHSLMKRDLLGRAGRLASLGLRHFSVTGDRFDQYMADIALEAERARRLYDLLVVPGVEITQNHLRSKKNSHIVALNIREFISADQPAEDILKEIRRQGALSIACHPHHRTTRRIEIGTCYLWDHRKRLVELVDV